MKQVSVFRSRKERYSCGRSMATFLRQTAPELGFRVDPYGFVAVSDILEFLREEHPETGRDHVMEIVAKDAQRRFEAVGDGVRARAGHRYSVDIPTPPVPPPEHLYHGTSPDAVPKILTEGLQRMGKAYVHLATTLTRARKVGERKSATPALLRIRAQEANGAGVRFWESGQVSDDGAIVLSDGVPARFIDRL